MGRCLTQYWSRLKSRSCVAARLAGSLPSRTLIRVKDGHCKKRVRRLFFNAITGNHGSRRHGVRAKYPVPLSPPFRIWHAHCRRYALRSRRYAANAVCSPPGNPIRQRATAWIDASGWRSARQYHPGRYAPVQPE